MRLLRSSLLVLLAALGACKATPGPVVDTGCVWVRPIFVAKADKLTEPTAGAILAHNETWARNCPAALPK